jgi:hypothetical protein
MGTGIRKPTASLWFSPLCTVYPQLSQWESEWLMWWGTGKDGGEMSTRTLIGVRVALVPIVMVQKCCA